MRTNAAMEIDTHQELGDGLMLRRSRAEDAEELASFNAQIHAEPDQQEPVEGVAVWTRDLLSSRHPSFQPQDFTVVVDTKTNKIVSTLNLISQTWTYEDIAFKVGRPELVGTHPDYRNRGLVRAQFEEIHRWSQARGEVVQAITGIPYYYRMFGYEMAVNLGGGRRGFLHEIPKLKEGESEPYLIRPAVPDDLDFVARLYEAGCRRSLLGCVRTPKMWRYELDGHSPGSINRQEVMIIEDRQATPVGYVTHNSRNWGTDMVATFYELDDGISWAAVTPSVMRYLKKVGEAHAEKDRKEPFESFGFHLGAEHPVYDLLGFRQPKVYKPYAWYMRVPNLTGFLKHIRPVLERRLRSSALLGYTGELKITFYRSGLRFNFVEGEITEIEDWRPMPQGHSGDIAFPGLTFLQVLFGYRTFEELDYAFPDCWSDTEEGRGLVNALFPKKTSDVWPIS